jgi:arsenate reductase
MKLLFICTHNRCRSILAEAIANYYGEGKIEAFSAGSSPIGEVHPLTISALKARSIPTEGLRSKSWDEFYDHEFDAVISVCDPAAHEPCPFWLNQYPQIHWGLSDPSAIKGSTELVNKAFEAAIKTLKNRMNATKQWLDEDIDAKELHRRLQKLANDSCS